MYDHIWTIYDGILTTYDHLLSMYDHIWSVYDDIYIYIYIFEARSRDIYIYIYIVRSQFGSSMLKKSVDSPRQTLFCVQACVWFLCHQDSKTR